MTVMHLGVLDIPYADSSFREIGRRKPKSMPQSSKTTGDIARILESKYAVMENFFKLHGQEVGDKLVESYRDALESLQLGAPVTLDPAGGAASEIESSFRAFLDNEEMNGIGDPGIPTQAALDGVSFRFKHPYKKRAARPSFINTGLYQGSFRFWVD